MTETSLDSEELIEQVRKALAGIDDSQVPDETIEQAHERFVEPILEQITEANPNQEHFNHAAVSWTAEKAFDAWMTFTRLRDREIETYVYPRQYREQLESRTDNALYVLGATRPPDTPNTVVTIKHDGKNRKINLNKNWIPDWE